MAEDMDKKIGKAIRRARRAKDRSQAWLATQCDLTYQQIQKYEDGSNRVSLATFIKIAKALEIKPGAEVRTWIEAGAK